MWSAITIYALSDLIIEATKGRPKLHQIAIFSSSTGSTVTSEVVGRLLADAGITTADGHNLASGRVLFDQIAYEIAVEVSAGDIGAQNPLRQHADGMGIDVNFTNPDNRRKQLLIADMDSTIVTSETLDDMAQLAGLGDAIAPITARSMRGELDFEESLDARLALLTDYPDSLIADALKHVTLTDGARPLVQTMRANGAMCYLVSGGFTAMTGPVAKQCGFHGDHANVLGVADGRLTGRIEKPILDRQAKLTFLDHYCDLHGLTRNDAACIGDGANDLAMLGAAGFGVAFHGKPLLRDQVALQLNHTDLTGLLFLQGYAQDEFA